MRFGHNKSSTAAFKPTMKPIKTKAQIRAEMEAQMHAFIEHGGSISEHPRGKSGRDVNEPLHPTIERNSQTRTPVADEIKAIEARRRPQKINKKRGLSKEESKTLILDDFGEPLRWR